ncbi:MAG: hypothetical protein AAF960_28470 [Bacteroidota bacterium]
MRFALSHSLFLLLFCPVLSAQYTPTEVRQLLAKTQLLVDTATQLPQVDTTELTQILAWSEDNDFTEGVLNANMLLGGYYYELEQNVVAIDYLLKASALAEVDNQPSTTAFLMSRIGSCYFKLGRVELAEKTFRTLQKYYETFTDASERAYYEGIVLGNLAQIDVSKGQLNLALEKLSTAYDVFTDASHAERADYQRNRNTITTNLGAIHLMLGQPKAALPYVRKYLALMRANDNPRELAKALGNVAYCEYLLVNFSTAYDLYGQSIEVSQKNNFPSVTYVTYKDLSDTYAAEGNYQQSLVYFQKYHHLRDSVQGVSVQEDLNALKIKYETAIKEQEIVQLNQDNQIQRQRLYLTIGGLALLGIASAAIVSWLMTRIKRRREQAELQALKMEKLHQEINRKKQDITQLALEISHKQDIAADVIEQLRTFEPYIAAKNQKRWRSVGLQVQQQLQTKKEKQLFHENIEAINQYFYHRLSQDFPNLNQNEKELCSYLRLGLSNKEIAALRNVTVEAIRISRYRLRKKLGFETKEQVSNFLAAL